MGAREKKSPGDGPVKTVMRSMDDFNEVYGMAETSPHTRSSKSRSILRPTYDIPTFDYDVT